MGATLSDEGIFSHPAIPDVVLYHVNVKEFVPLLRDVTRHQLAANLARRSRKVTRTGRVQRTDFSTLDPRIDWDATLALIREPFDEQKQSGLTQDQSKALTVILTGAQRTMDRMFRHKEPLAPGLPPVASPRCPWCEEECDETPSHIFWNCDAFHHIRSSHLARITSIQNRSPGSIPVENWEATCKNNGISPEDPRLLEWVASIPKEDTYPPLPPWVPDPAFICQDEEGRVQFATDGGTSYPTVRRLRHSGIGIYGGGASSWQYSSVLRGPIQQNDKAELVAVVLFAEAVLQQIHLFPNGVEVFIDNEAVCDMAVLVTGGQPFRPSAAHAYWWKRLRAVVVSLLPRKKVIKCTWVPSHLGQQDVDAGRITARQLHLNSGADALATTARDANSPPMAVCVDLERRMELVRALQHMLIAIHIARKEKETSLISSRLRTQSVLPRADKVVPLDQPIWFLVRDFPNYCVDPGEELVRNSSITPLVARIFHPPSSRKSFEVLEAVKWYWAELSWPAYPSQFNRGATWIEFTLDFIAATNFRYLATEHKKGTQLALAKSAFSALSHFLHGKTGKRVFPCDSGKVTSLSPFGIRNALEGLKIAPKFICQYAWSSVLYEAVKDTDSPFQSLSLLPVEKVLSPLHRPYAPLRDAFLRAFPFPPMGEGAPPPVVSPDG
jgi:hypothetical protein